MVIEIQVQLLVCLEMKKLGVKKWNIIVSIQSVALKKNKWDKRNFDQSLIAIIKILIFF